MKHALMVLTALSLAACGQAENGTSDADQHALESAAEQAQSLGPAVGSPFPDFALTNADGEIVRLADIAGGNGTVIYFNRSVDWCPYCQQQTMEIDAMARLFADQGYGLAVITYDPVEDLQAFALRREIGIPLLSDRDSSLTDTLGIRDPVYTDPEHYAFGVAYPITFVIAPDGSIRHKLWHEPGLGDERGYRTRVTVGAVLSLIGAL